MIIDMDYELMVIVIRRELKLKLIGLTKDFPMEGGGVDSWKETPLLSTLLM